MPRKALRDPIAHRWGINRILRRLLVGGGVAGPLRKAIQGAWSEMAADSTSPLRLHGRRGIDLGIPPAAGSLGPLRAPVDLVSGRLGARGMLCGGFTFPWSHPEPPSLHLRFGRPYGPGRKHLGFSLVPGPENGAALEPACRSAGLVRNRSVVLFRPAPDQQERGSLLPRRNHRSLDRSSPAQAGGVRRDPLK